MAGRPSKFTDVARDLVIEALKKGYTRSAAAGAAGVHVSQIGRWCQHSASFATDCAIAEQEAEARMTELAYGAAAEQDPKIAADWLKRRRRLDYGDSLDIRKLDDDTLLRLLSLEAGGDPSQSSDE